MADLQAELAEMMIDVQIRPPHPRRLGHASEDRMRGPIVVCSPGGDDLKERLEFGEIGGEFTRCGATRLLIHLRPRGDSGWPPEWSVQSDPFDDCGLKQPRRRAGSFLMRHQTERIAQVAYHLMCRHSSPSPGTLRTESLHSQNDLRLVLRPRHRLH